MIAWSLVMLTLKKCKKILGEKAKEWTDEEVLMVRDWLDLLADFILDIYKKGLNDEKKNTNLHSGVYRRTKQRV